MDTASYLKRHGWRGEGHALSVTGNGIVKPLLVSKKVDYLGVGLNKHAAVSDQWWMRAFDQGLKDLGTGKQTVLGSVREKGIVHGGLYGRFVKGESIAGTFAEEDQSKSAETIGKKRKRDVEGTRDAKRQRKLDDVACSKVENHKHAEGSVSRHSKRLDRQAKTFLHEAASRGLLPREPSLKPMKPGSKTAAEIHGEEAVLAVFRQAGLHAISTVKALGEKPEREARKIGRALQRAARAHLIAQLPPKQRAEIEQHEARQADQRKKKKRVEGQRKDDAAKEEAISKRKQKSGQSTKSESRQEIQDVPESEIDVVDLGDTEKAHNKRESKKAREARKREKIGPTLLSETKAEATKEGKIKSKRKRRAQENMAMQILAQSRRAQQDDDSAIALPLEDADSPLIAVETRSGSFTEEEMDLAQRKAGKVLWEDKKLRAGSKKAVKRKTSKE